MNDSEQGFSGSYELDELGTLQTMLQLYRIGLRKLSEADRGRYVSREEYIKVVNSILKCLESSVSQTERLMSCVERLVDSVDRLTDEVIYLRSKVDEEW